MVFAQILAENARKTPRQARSVNTVEAIFEATIQVLISDGPGDLTTTRVAERAGVSVGSLYQYFPNKQALFHAVNERYLKMLADRVEAACQAHRGAPYAQMAEALVGTYIEVKIERRDVTIALYRAAAEVNVAGIVETMSRRIETASEAMFATACDARFSNLSTVNVMMLNVLCGTVRNVFDRGMSELLVDGGLRNQLTQMFCTYLDAAKIPA
ncbi:TetR/AcrR family transcriptional regulator [Rhizobium mesosinicum]|uniref:TetR/AcrR family transcriptional regulator n=1 Tax=Rhizobium mesosinicum TaxID=335017 RepID=A0ABS7GXW2_9HYPH|nr:TetR/AcrR family transcriptional regulator [Rhizobium mesosinicum]MBW9054779.1 TetR/AcrR family transcriptional regulator [Rhizobium mesosinicum]